jgi:replicative DNA helicase
MPRVLVAFEAEQAVLGALMADDEAWDLVADVLRPGMFGGQGHDRIADAVWSLKGQKKPTDAVTVASALEANGMLGTAVPHELPYALARSTGMTSNARHYALTVRELWALREARKAAAALLEDDSDTPAAQLIDGFAKRLVTIESGKIRKPLRYSEGLQREAERLEREAVHPEAAPTTLIPTGLGPLDVVIGGYEPGVPQLYAGRPGGGKSALAPTMARLAASRGIPTMLFWWEDSERQALIRNLSQQAGIPRALFRHGKMLQPEHWGRVQHAIIDASGWPLWIDSTKGIKGSEIGRVVRRYAREYGIKLFLADHLGEVKLDDDLRGTRGDERLGDALREFRDSTEEVGAACVAFHQLNREVEKLGGKPRLSWLYGSGQLEQVARVVAFVSNEGRAFNIDVVKQNHGPRDVRVELGWDPETASVFEPHAQVPLC